MEARGLARVAALLSAVVAQGLHRDLGFRCVDAYVEERLDIAPSRARALLRIERALARGELAPPLEPSGNAFDADSDLDPAGLQTGAITRLEKASERLVFDTAPEVS